MFKLKINFTNNVNVIFILELKNAYATYYFVCYLMLFYVGT